jgi:hypothetical protein
MKKSIYAALIFLLVASGASLAQSDQPTLGELAKRHQATKKASKTLTNDDVATATAPENNQKAAAVASSAPVTTADSPAKSDNKNNKDSASRDASAAKDSPAVAELRKKLDSYKEQLDGWKQSAKRYENLLANETSDFRRQMYQDALEGDKRNVALFQEKVDQTQADLAKSQKGSVSGGSGSN